MNANSPATFFGWHRDEAEVAHVLARLPRPLFSSSAAGLLDSTPEHEVYLWEACRKVTGSHLPAHNQGRVGCCVGEGFSVAVEYLQCVEIALKQEAEEYCAISSESIYALSRVEVGGGRIGGDGSVGAWAAKAVQDFGVLPRKAFGSVDLTRFSEERARAWGSRGLPDELEPEARKHPVRTASLVQSFEEARVAIANGYPVAVCSDRGFSLTRDAEGFCAPEGSWAHCMCFVGATAGRRPGLCVLQSWGPDMPRGPIGLGDHPTNAFWIDAAICDQMLRQGDSWALSAFAGFPRRLLDWLL